MKMKGEASIAGSRQHRRCASLFFFWNRVFYQCCNLAKNDYGILQWKEAENIDYSLYGTPLESTTYKFAKCLQKRFGIIPDVTDHDYITNSYHVNVREHIDAFTKLKFESEFQKLSPGGAISYVEVPNMQHNIRPA